MPANKISYTPENYKYDPIEHMEIGFDIAAPAKAVYISQHSNAEYETLRKAFLLLGERYDELQDECDELQNNYDMLSNEYDIMEEDYDFLEAEYDEMLYSEDE